MTARELCARCLVKMDARGGYSNLVLDAALRASPLDGRDKAFAALLFYGVLERRITLDACLAPLCAGGLKKLSPAVRAALETALYELLYLPDTPQSAAVSQAVESARALGQPRAAGLVNGVLRSFLRTGGRVPLPQDPDARLSVQYSVARPLAALLSGAYGRPAAEAFLARSCGAAPVFLRVNPLRTSAAALQALLAEEGVESAPVEGLAHCLRLTAGTGGDLRRLAAFERGLFHVQDVSSQLCALALDPRPGMKVLDVCAAPGGKAFTAAQLMEDRGSLLALDLHPNRAGLIAQGAARLGLGCLRTGAADAGVYDPGRGLFDRVLCDVPCSGLGVLRRKPELRYKTPAEFAGLPQVQHKILEVSAQYTAVGGSLVYSTCTLNPEENQQVAEAFLAAHPGWAPGALPAPLGQGWQTTLLETPWNCDGFYMAVLRRDR